MELNLKFDFFFLIKMSTGLFSVLPDDIIRYIFNKIPDILTAKKFICVSHKISSICHSANFLISRNTENTKAPIYIIYRYYLNLLKKYPLKLIKMFDFCVDINSKTINANYHYGYINYHPSINRPIVDPLVSLIDDMIYFSQLSKSQHSISLIYDDYEILPVHPDRFKYLNDIYHIKLFNFEDLDLLEYFRNIHNLTLVYCSNIKNIDKLNINELYLSNNRILNFTLPNIKILLVTNSNIKDIIVQNIKSCEIYNSRVENLTLDNFEIMYINFSSVSNVKFKNADTLKLLSAKINNLQIHELKYLSLKQGEVKHINSCKIKKAEIIDTPDFQNLSWVSSMDSISLRHCVIDDVSNLCNVKEVTLDNCPLITNINCLSKTKLKLVYMKNIADYSILNEIDDIIITECNFPYNINKQGAFIKKICAYSTNNTVS